jgi:hypothetical protein
MDQQVASTVTSTPPHIYHHLHKTHQHQHRAPAPSSPPANTTSPHWRKHRVFVTTTTTTNTTTTIPTSIPKQRHLVFFIIVANSLEWSTAGARCHQPAAANSLPSTRRHQPTTAI